MTDARGGMLDSIRARLTAWYALVLALFVFGFGIALYGFFARATQRSVDQSLEETAHAFAAAWNAAQATQAERLVGAAEAVREFRFRDLDVLVYDESRRVVAASRRGRRAAPACRRGGRRRRCCSGGRPARGGAGRGGGRAARRTRTAW